MFYFCYLIQSSWPPSKGGTIPVLKDEESESQRAWVTYPRPLDGKDSHPGQSVSRLTPHPFWLWHLLITF